MAQNWFKHTFVDSRLRPRGQILALIVLGVTVTLIFGAAYLSQVATSVSLNRDIQESLAERDRLERQNEDLRADIAALQTVPRLLQRAEALGFRPATASDIEYMVIEGYDPNRSETVVSLGLDIISPQAATPYTDTFSGWLQQQWASLREQFETFGQ